jgi:hypothetical protein
LALPASWLSDGDGYGNDGDGNDGSNGGADLILGELLDTGLLGEGLVASMRDAAARLVRTRQAKRRRSSSEESSSPTKTISGRSGRAVPCFDALPASGTVVCVPVEGELVRAMSGLHPTAAAAAAAASSSDQTPPPPAPVPGGSAFSSSSSSSSPSSYPTSTLIYGFRAPAACARCEGSAAAEGMHLRWKKKKQTQRQRHDENHDECAVPAVATGDDDDDDSGDGDDGSGEAASSLEPMAAPQEAFSVDFHDPDNNGTAGDNADNNGDAGAAGDGSSADAPSTGVGGLGRTCAFVVERNGSIDGVAYWWHVAMLRDETRTRKKTTGRRQGGGGYTDGDDDSDSCRGGGGNGDDASSDCGHGKKKSPLQQQLLPRMSTAPGQTACPDHWRQNLVPLPSPLRVSKGDVCSVTLARDDDMVWVASVEVVKKGEDSEITDEEKRTVATSPPPAPSPPQPPPPPPVCVCGLHSSLSRQRLASLNDPRRRNALAMAVEALQKEHQGSWSNNRGLVVVLGDGPLLPYLCLKAGFEVLVCSYGPGSGEQGDGTSITRDTSESSGGGSNGGFGRWLTEQCALEGGGEVMSRRLSFANLPFPGTCDGDNDSGPATSNSKPLRSAVWETLKAMELRDRGIGQSGGGESGQHPGTETSRDDSGGSAASGFQSETWGQRLVGVVAEPFFEDLDEPGGSGGGGWGWESLLLLASAVQSLEPTSEGEGEDADGGGDDCGDDGGDDGGDGSNGTANEGSRELLKVVNDDDDNGRGTKRQCRPPLTPTLQDLLHAPHAMNNAPPNELAVFPYRAVVRGAFLCAEELWASLHVPQPPPERSHGNEDEDHHEQTAVMIEGVDMGAAFEVDETEHENSDAGGDNDDNAAHGDETDGHAADGDEAALGLAAASCRAFLRCAVTGDAAVDAVPFPLSQWGGSSLVVGSPLDLATLHLGSSGDGGNVNEDEEGYWEEAIVSLAPLVDNLRQQQQQQHLQKEAGFTRDGGSKSSTTAHAFALWIDYDLTPPQHQPPPSPLHQDSKPTTPHAAPPLPQPLVAGAGLGVSASTWLRHGPDVWYARQGVLAFESEVDVAALGCTALHTTVDRSGSLGLRFVLKDAPEEDSWR